MPTRRLFPAYALLFIFANVPVLRWIGGEWMRTEFGMIGAVLFVAGCGVLFVTRPARGWRPSIALPFLLAAAVLLLMSMNIVPIGYNILRSICFVLGCIAGASAFFSLSKQDIIRLSSWLLSCLPVIPLLGSTIGLVNREIYATLLHLFSGGAKRLGTSLYDGDYAFHIDAGCSGVQGMYLLFGCWSLLGLLGNPKEVRFRALFEGLAAYWILNGLRVGTLYILHNKLYLSSLGTVDEGLGIACFLIALGITVYRMQLPYPLPRRSA